MGTSSTPSSTRAKSPGKELNATGDGNGEGHDVVAGVGVRVAEGVSEEGE